MANAGDRARIVRDKLYGKKTKAAPFEPDSLPAPPPFQRAIDRRANKYKWSR